MHGKGRGTEQGGRGRQRIHRSQVRPDFVGRAVGRGAAAETGTPAPMHPSPPCPVGLTAIPPLPPELEPIAKEPRAQLFLTSFPRENRC